MCLFCECLLYFRNSLILLVQISEIVALATKFYGGLYHRVLNVRFETTHVLILLPTKLTRTLVYDCVISDIKLARALSIYEKIVEWNILSAA